MGELPHPIDVLREFPEGVPEWLREADKSSTFDHEHFFSSRVVYYPGFGADGHPLKVFGGAHAAACFLFVDFNVTRDEILNRLHNHEHQGHPRGYETVVSVRSQSSS